ncbi:hypothetical protein [Methylobacterium nodulans]|uniref:hypothetical protein n=1 Tax=Methylobacterium nodulans TaxID=114616 RepID=UPI0012EE45F3|nr:hypothetical protein [Methylobacterium nodulans]
MTTPGPQRMAGAAGQIEPGGGDPPLSGQGDRVAGGLVSEPAVAIDGTEGVQRERLSQSRRRGCEYLDGAVLRPQAWLFLLVAVIIALGSAPSAHIRIADPPAVGRVCVFNRQAQIAQIGIIYDSAPRRLPIGEMKSRYYNSCNKKYRFFHSSGMTGLAPCSTRRPKSARVSHGEIAPAHIQITGIDDKAISRLTHCFQMPSDLMQISHKN